MTQSRTPAGEIRLEIAMDEAITPLDWLWYASNSGERFDLGPFDSREAAVKAGVDQYGYDYEFVVVESRKAKISLSGCFDANEWMDGVDDGVLSELSFDDPVLIDVGTELTQSLEKTVRAAINKWQIDNNLEIIPYTFEDMRNYEALVVDAPEPPTRLIRRGRVSHD